MKAHIEARFMRNTVAVWVTEQGPTGGGKRLLRMNTQAQVGGASSDPGEWTWWWEDLTENPGEEMHPTFEFPTELFEALVAAGSDFSPPSSAVAEHLKDATEVRDRLLKLVELGKFLR